MPNEETGVSTQEAPAVEPVQETSPDITAESSVDEIIASREEAEPSEESPSSKDEQSDPQGEGETPPAEDVGTPAKSDDEVEVGKPIPYDRFKEVNDSKNTLTTENEQIKSELEEAQSALKDPEVLGMVLKKRGYTEEAIDKYFADKNIQRVKEPGEAPEFDLNTVEGWNKNMDHKIEQALERRLAPVEQKITQSERTRQETEHSQWLEGQKKEAAVLAKDRYGIEFGEISKDESNPNTAVGKMWEYLKTNPDDAKLGYTKILKLAMADSAIEKGVEKGVKKEKERVNTVKSAAMESETTVTTDEQPSADWSEERIIAWRHQHG